MLNPHILFDNTKTSKKIKNFLDHKIKNISLSKCNLIIVIGGDGFMLSALKKYNKYKKPFYGINAGSYGFLMNKFSSKNTIKNLSKANMITISPLEMVVKTKNNQIKKSIAVNEVWEYNIKENTCKPLYRGRGPLAEPDNVTVSNTGLVMAAEDRDNMEICGISKNNNSAFPIVRIKDHHKKSEVTGPAFDPSGTRLYFSSQNGKNGKVGITYEVTGPFNKLS